MDAVFLPMTAITVIYVAVNVLTWRILKDRQMTVALRIAVGVFYGILSILSTHFGVDYGSMMLNVRDLGPLSAGLFFDPASGIIAGLIGGIERYIAGTYWGVASYTRVACSISTCLAGFLAAFLNIYIFKGKRPSVFYAFCMGALIEVFHMYVVLITHRDNMDMAYHVVQSCAIPMILFSAMGLAATAFLISLIFDPEYSPFGSKTPEKVTVSQRFQVWLFAVTIMIFMVNASLDYTLQTNASLQTSQKTMLLDASEIAETYNGLSPEEEDPVMIYHKVGKSGEFRIISDQGLTVSGTDQDGISDTPPEILDMIATHKAGKFFTEEYSGSQMLCRIEVLDDGCRLLLMMPESEVYEARNIEAYENLLNDILIFAVIFILISLLVENIVVKNLHKVNTSLRKITDGDLDEKVEVYDSYEFASLSDDINLTVNALKGYIKAAEQRIEQELLLARTIQTSSLPKSFDFRHPGFDVYAIMDPAREVGGDFYDYFFVDNDKVAFVIADVAGKGIPAALLMMRSKTTVRSLAETGKRITEVVKRTNEELCINNDACMFVTMWMGILNLRTGRMKCVNAGHEYPALMREGGSFELFREKHCPALGFREDIPYTHYEVDLSPGDIFFVYTDGIPEAVNGQMEQYGTERMLSVLNENRDAELQDMLSAVRTGIRDFSGDAEQFDDITMLGFRYNGMDL